MSADLSRVRFDPLRDHAGVGPAAGSPAAGRRLERAGGARRPPAARPGDRSGTGQGDRVGGTATVSALDPRRVQGDRLRRRAVHRRGRMYVDGLLAENHGDPVDGFDPMLAEQGRHQAGDYGKQPYWPTPDPLPTGRYRARLPRRVAARGDPVEAPDLVEPAVGVDTTARTQTVWQVRLLTNVDPLWPLFDAAGPTSPAGRS